LAIEASPKFFTKRALTAAFKTKVHGWEANGFEFENYDNDQLGGLI